MQVSSKFKLHSILDSEHMKVAVSQKDEKRRIYLCLPVWKLFKLRWNRSWNCDVMVAKQQITKKIKNSIAIFLKESLEWAIKLEWRNYCTTFHLYLTESVDKKIPYNICTIYMMFFGNDRSKYMFDHFFLQTYLFRDNLY